MTIENFDLMEEENAVQEAESWLTQKVFSEITQEVYQRGSFTVVIIHALSDRKLYEGCGFAKARQEVSISQYDSDRGRKVAFGRAVHDLFQELRKTNKK